MIPTSTMMTEMTVEKTGLSIKKSDFILNLILLRHSGAMEIEYPD